MKRFLACLIPVFSFLSVALIASPAKEVVYADTIQFYINSDEVELDELSVRAYRKIDQVRLSPLKADVLDLTQAQTKATDIQSLLNAGLGIRMRNTGAVGASNEIILNGFSGRSIKLMRYGIPLDYLGSGFGLTAIPVNAIERIEIYKGNLPTEIGVDALGGAINLVSKNMRTSEWQLSLEEGSFNTHIATLSGFKRFNDHWSLGVFAFGNDARNDYKVGNLPYYDDVTGRNSYIEARMFHNRFRQYYAEAHVNLEHLSWADLLQLRITTFGLKQDIQHDFTNRDRAFGAVYRTESARFVPALTYRKTLADGKLNTTQFVVYSRIDNLFVDTLKNAYYDWKGVKHSAVAASEIGNVYLSAPSELGVASDFHHITYRGLGTYAFNKQHVLTVNVVNNYTLNVRDDEYKPTETNRVRYNRTIAGVGYQADWLQSRLTNIAQAKVLLYQTHGKAYNHMSGNLTGREQGISKQGLSLSFSTKYNLSPQWLVRSSFENTYRLPDPMEIFGDNTFVLSNLNLSPEQSNNLNVGTQWHRSGKYTVEINAFLRDTRDLIKLKEINQYQGVFLNLEKVQGYGIELDASYTFFNCLDISGNLTYNDFRYKDAANTAVFDTHFVGARISNIPFYYGNIGLEYSSDKIFGKELPVRAYWLFNYVHQYYSDDIEKQYEPDGFLGLFGKSQIYTDRVIPQQYPHTAGLSLEFPLNAKHSLTIGAEIRNIFDSDIYNNFKIQSPGRNFRTKVVYLFN